MPTFAFSAVPYENRAQVGTMNLFVVFKGADGSPCHPRFSTSQSLIDVFWQLPNSLHLHWTA
jgi:hypothetical protein